ncbi:MAG TPA: VOC family protein [Candidatus Sulfotelmatobacter sp.]|nr:VOC family protein [Candidatus Sulfotelmatobacter sp.]
MTQRLSPWAFVLAVRDLERSAAYYRDVLGFTIKWPEGSDWRLAERDGVRMMLGQCPNETPASEIGAHSWYGYLEVDDVDALHAEIVARGAVATAPRDAPYGMREFLVTTVDGHRFMFAQEIGRPRA